MSAPETEAFKEYSLFNDIPRRTSATKPLVIVQARVGSTRLPGKILKEIDGTPLLRMLLDRLHFIEKPVEIVVATTHLEKDDPTAECVRHTGLPCFRGSEDDVLDRFWRTSQVHPSDAVVRITADCPLMDPWIVSRALDLFYHLKVDYLSNTLHRTFPRGFDVEIVKPHVLERAAHEASFAYDREHVTPFIVSRGKEFSLANFISSQDLSPWRITVDTQEDFSFVKKIVSILGCSSRSCSFTSVKELFLQHPEWARENYGLS